MSTTTSGAGFAAAEEGFCVFQGTCVQAASANAMSMANNALPFPKFLNMDIPPFLDRRLPADRYAGILPASPELLEENMPAGSRRSSRQDAGGPDGLQAWS
jgi:hypothetical protein